MARKNSCRPALWLSPRCPAEDQMKDDSLLDDIPEAQRRRSGGDIAGHADVRLPISVSLGLQAMLMPAMDCWERHASPSRATPGSRSRPLPGRIRMPAPRFERVRDRPYFRPPDFHLHDDIRRAEGIRHVPPSTLLGAAYRDDRLGSRLQQQCGVHHTVLLGADQFLAVEDQERIRRLVDHLELRHRAALGNLGNLGLARGDRLVQRAVGCAVRTRREQWPDHDVAVGLGRAESGPGQPIGNRTAVAGTGGVQGRCCIHAITIHPGCDIRGPPRLAK
jgi:hypothetical protein